MCVCVCVNVTQNTHKHTHNHAQVYTLNTLRNRYAQTCPYICMYVVIKLHRFGIITNDMFINIHPQCLRRRLNTSM